MYTVRTCIVPYKIGVGRQNNIVVRLFSFYFYRRIFSYRFAEKPIETRQQQTPSSEHRHRRRQSTENARRERDRRIPVTPRRRMRASACDTFDRRRPTPFVRRRHARGRSGNLFDFTRPATGRRGAASFVPVLRSARCSSRGLATLRQYHRTPVASCVTPIVDRLLSM